MENLEFLTSLEFLSLEGNSISTISSIRSLSNLLYLNLANNKIIFLNYTEIPKTIAILKVGNNPCTADLSYRRELIEYFEELDELDNIQVTKERFEIAGLEYLPASSAVEPVEEPNDETRPDTVATMRSENERFMTEDEELQFSVITETAWEVVQKSKQRMEELHRLRLNFRDRILNNK
jgi:hypothetical protein